MNMKKHLSIIGILASFLVCLVLAGCGTESAAETASSGTEGASFTAGPATTGAPPITEPPAPPRPTGLVEVTGLEPMEGEMICAAVPDGAGAALLLQRWDQGAQRTRYRVCFPDPETAAVTASAELAFPEDWDPAEQLLGLSGLKVTETELRLLDEYNERCAVFDRKGRFMRLEDWPVMDREHLGWQNFLLGNDVFWKDPALAHCRSDLREAPFSALGFYDEADRIHLLEGYAFDDFPACLGHRVLAVENQIQEEARRFSLLDLDRSLVLDRLILPDQDEEGRWQNPCGHVLGPDWVLLALTESGESGETPKLLFWYPEEGREEALEEKILTTETLTQALETLCADLEAQGLHILLDTAPPTELTPTTGLAEPESTCETGCSLFGEYRILSQLKTFVEKLPKGFVRELYANLPGEDSPSWETLNIYLVRSIPGDAAGFASSWTEDLLICFATEEFSPSHLAHEFMHIMDVRLEHWLWSQNRDLEGEWWDLSPDFAYDTELTQEQEEEIAGCFVSWYARTSSNEDRAETFQFLFDREEPLEDCWWYKENPGVRKKVQVLTDLIREAFPSVREAEAVWWER